MGYALSDLMQMNFINITAETANSTATQQSSVVVIAASTSAILLVLVGVLTLVLCLAISKRKKASEPQMEP